MKAQHLPTAVLNEIQDMPVTKSAKSVSTSDTIKLFALAGSVTLILLGIAIAALTQGIS